jgi:hypothetical protein
MIWTNAIELYKEVDGLQDNSPMDTNQPIDVSQKDSTCPESLKN